MCGSSLFYVAKISVEVEKKAIFGCETAKSL